MTIYGDILDKEIQLVLEMNKKLSGKDSGHIKGTAFEHSFRNLLSKFTPENINISRGWILHPDGTQSDERDFLVYDKSRAPAFLFDNSTGIIPLLSILYDIQVKSSLTPKRIKESYEKVDKKIPYNVLICNNGCNLLKEYSKIDPGFLTNPAIIALSSENDGYYCFNIEKQKFREILSKENLIKGIKESTNINIKLNDEDIENKLTINKHKVNDLLNYEISICKWYKYQSNETSLKAFITGFANTLYKTAIGQYLSKECNAVVQSIAILDHNNNLIYDKIFFDTPIKNLQLSTSISISEDGNIQVSVKEEN